MCSNTTGKFFCQQSFRYSVCVCVCTMRCDAISLFTVCEVLVHQANEKLHSQVPVSSSSQRLLHHPAQTILRVFYLENSQELKQILSLMVQQR